MSLTLDISQLRTDLRSHCGTVVTSSGFDNDSVDLLLNRSLWALLNRFPFRETEITKLFSTVAAEPRYTLPTLFEAVRMISIEDIFDQSHTILNPMTELEYETEFVNNANAQGKPERYVRYGTELKLFPTPDTIYPITVKHLICLQDMDDSNAAFPVPKNWYEIVLFGGIYRGFYALRNPTQAATFKSQQDSWILEAQPVESKEEADRHKAGVKIIGYGSETLYGPY